MKRFKNCLSLHCYKSVNTKSQYLRSAYQLLKQIICLFYILNKARNLIDVFFTPFRFNFHGSKSISNITNKILNTLCSIRNISTMRGNKLNFRNLELQYLQYF